MRPACIHFPSICILTVWTYYRQGYVDLTAAGLICLGFFICGFLGAKIATGLSNAALEGIFGIALFLIAIKMIFAR